MQNLHSHPRREAVVSSGEVLYGPLLLDKRFHVRLRGVQPWAIQHWHTTGQPLFLVSNCEQLFRDQKSGIFQLESSGHQDPERILEAHPAAAA